MAGLESDTVGGYNAMLKKQQALPGEVLVTTVLFNDQYQLLHDRIDIRGLRPITEKEYEVGGCTALLDAVGRTLHKIINVQRQTAPEQQAGQVVFVITTDGLENASQEYSYKQISAMIQKQKEKFGWEFIFLGANIDAVAAAAQCGIGADRAANFNADGQGARLNFEAVSDFVSECRSNQNVSAAWKARIDEDFNRRKGPAKKK
jgi:hypothetical protein